jgi:hypothetical protein
MSTLAEKVAVYVDKLVLQYRLQLRARATVAIFAKQLLADDLASQIQAAFTIDTAVGEQLDVLGKYVGIARNIGTATPVGYFGFWNIASTLDPTKYQGVWNPALDDPALPAAAGGNAGWWYAIENPGTSATPIAATFLAGDVIASDGAAWAKVTTDNANGFTATANPATNANGIWYRTSFSGALNTNLTDAQYRTVIKLKAILNSDPATLYSIVQALWAFFPNQISVVDGLDMTLSYFVNSAVPLDVGLLRQFLPKPMGVGIAVSIVSPIPGVGDEITTEDGFSLTTEDGSSIISTEGS